jgi:hypothetical protein
MILMGWCAVVASGPFLEKIGHLAGHLPEKPGKYAEFFIFSLKFPDFLHFPDCIFQQTVFNLHFCCVKRTIYFLTL